MTETEQKARAEKVWQAIEARERDGEPAERKAFEEERHLAMTPLGRHLAENPKSFRLYTYAADGSFTGGDAELYAECQAQNRARQLRAEPMDLPPSSRIYVGRAG